MAGPPAPPVLGKIAPMCRSRIGTASEPSDTRSRSASGVRQLLGYAGRMAMANYLASVQRPRPTLRMPRAPARMHPRLLQTGRECVREISHQGSDRFRNPVFAIVIVRLVQVGHFSLGVAILCTIAASAGVDGKWVALYPWGSRSTTHQGMGR
jgi:hypothetical protein